MMYSVNPLNRRTFSRPLLRGGSQSRTKFRPVRRCRVSPLVQCSHSNGWPSFPFPPEGFKLLSIVKYAYDRVIPAVQAVAIALEAIWTAQKRWVYQAWARVAVSSAVVLGLITAAANAWGIPVLNQQLPQIACQAKDILQRDVTVGRVYWLGPTGALGLHPLASIGPVVIGPGSAERSSVTIERVALSLNPLQSILRGRLVVSLRASGAEINLQQADNFSWFGFPDDTSPSSRNFVPGLVADEENGRKPGSGGAESGGSGGMEDGPKREDVEDHQQKGSQNSSYSKNGMTKHLFTSLPSERYSFSRKDSESFLKDVAQELMEWHAKKERTAGDTLVPAVMPLEPRNLNSVSSGRFEKHAEAPTRLVLMSMGKVDVKSDSSRDLKADLSVGTHEAQNSQIHKSSEILPSRKMKRKLSSLIKGPFSDGRERDSKAILVGEEEDKAADDDEGSSSKRRQQLDAINSIQLGIENRDENAVPMSSGPVREPQGNPLLRKSRAEVSVNVHRGIFAKEPQIPKRSIVAEHADDADIILDHRVSTEQEQAPNVGTSDQAFVDSSTGTVSALNDGLSSGGDFARSSSLSSKKAVELINSLPTLNTRIRKTKKEKQEQHHMPVDQGFWKHAHESSAAAQSINQLDAIDGKNAQLKLTVDVPAIERFAGVVVDRGMERRRTLGSKALQRAHHWKPTKPPQAFQRRFDLTPHGLQTPTGSQKFKYQDSVEEKLEFDLRPGYHGKTSQSDENGVDMSSIGSDVSNAPQQRAQSGSRYQITHPGYFPKPSGPVYTPAPPDAIRRAKDRGLVAALHRCVVAVVKYIQQQIVLGDVKIDNATLLGHIYGEEKPRKFEDVSVSLRLGRKYNRLVLDIHAKAHERDPSSCKCTMPNPQSHRHLRDVTGVRALQQLNASTANTEEHSASIEPAVEEKGQSLFLERDDGDGDQSRRTGGKLRVYVEVNDLLDNDLATGGSRVPKLLVKIRGDNLHAPLVERIVELPMDISRGRADGELVIKSDTVESWKFPKFYGKIAVIDSQFHFWDATDDIFDADLDLVFEGDQLFIHRATGRFGAIPMSLSGDLDLNPATGSYRLTANVPGVEVNTLRATLGVRPTPFPVAAAVKGNLHISGPLEKPIFSGHAIAIRPSENMIDDCERTAALETLLADKAAVGAYDKVSFSSAELVFSLDTASNTMNLHSIQAEPVSGGKIHGYGRLKVDPSAEMDSSALDIFASGTGLQPKSLAKPYLISDATLPPSLVEGSASMTATMKGAGLAPIVDVSFSLPNTKASGTACFTRTSTSASFASPSLEASGSILVQPATFEDIRAAITQEQASALAKPDIVGCNANIVFKGLDMVPLAYNETDLRKLAQKSGEPLRLKVNGHVKMSGEVKYIKEESQANERMGIEEESNSFQPLQKEQVNPSQASLNRQSWKLVGNVDIDDVRVNQLRLYRALRGNFDLSESMVHFHGKGLRPDESLDIDLSLPLVPQGSIKNKEREIKENSGEDGISFGAEKSREARMTGSSAALRCGPLSAYASVDRSGSAVDIRVTNLKLDELELASLRGDLQEISCSLNFRTQTGRGKLNLLTPRYSGVSGESLNGGFRWEKDVVRLEKLVLQQKTSRYEVQGEYVIPTVTSIPHSTADLQWLHAPGEEHGTSQAISKLGRWRLRVDVPSADMQEILPAARLLQSAASRAPTDYGRAKAAFIEALKDISLATNNLSSHLLSLAQSVPGVASSGSRDVKKRDSLEKKRDAVTTSMTTGDGHFHMPGLQDIRGIWNGSIQAFGGGGGATSCEFDVRGQGWGWGHSIGVLDAVVAKGNYHSEEGVQLQEFVLKSGEAKLLVRGSLFSEHQDANILLTDFPLSTLQPLFRAVPALHHMAPAVTSTAPEPVSSPLPIGMLANAISHASQHWQHETGSDADSPIAGMLYVSGTLGGSKANPTGEVAVRVYEAAIGPTRLAQAQAFARITENMLLVFNVDIIPVEGHRKSGYVRASGTVPLSSKSQTRNPKSQVSTIGSRPSNGDGESDFPTMLPGSSDLDVRLSVRDGGMSVLTSMTPDFIWQAGQADVVVRLTGSLDSPMVSGSAVFGKALIDSKFLKYPLLVSSIDMKCDNSILQVSTMDVRCGRKGHLRARGTLPLQPQQPTSRSDGAMQKVQNRLTVDINGLEMRVRNAYTGQLDALLTVRNSILRPVIGGSMRFSRGSIYLIPQGQEVSGLAVASSGSGVTSSDRNSVAKLFALLTRGEDEYSSTLGDALRQEVQTVEGIMGEAAGANVTFDSLALHFGPELRAVYPLVMNFAVAGELNLFGPAVPEAVSVEGVLKLPGGDINLVAAQLELDREHVNTLIFSGERGISGIDPVVDVVLTSGDVRVSVLGRASEWAEHLSMRSMTGASASGDGGDRLDATEAARLLETKLKAALLADDGQLALNRLAGTTVSTLLPKIETQGTVGGTKWRLVSAPAIPGLLDPLLSDPSNFLGSIAMGTEAEVEFGRRLQAAMTRKLRDSDVTTRWMLNYNLSSKLRMQFSISSASPYDKTLTIQYNSSEGSR